jgi:two-component system KDP operon response regulator KdpE
LARILVIDDDSAISEIVRAILEKAGHEVFAASNGLLGLASLAREPVELVIADIVMPEMDGIEVVRQLRSMTRPPKIIVMTGGNREGAANQLAVARGLGADATITKPLRAKHLLDTLAELLPRGAGAMRHQS